MNKEEKENFCTLINLIRVSSQRFASIIYEDMEITKVQAIVLLWIAKHEEVTINHIASNLQINQGNASNICKKLEKLAYIKRERNTSDERIVNLSLTPKGKKIVEQIDTKLTVIEERLKDFPKEKLISIVEGFQNLNEVLEYLVEKGGENVTIKKDY